MTEYKIEYLTGTVEVGKPKYCICERMVPNPYSRWWNGLWQSDEIMVFDLVPDNEWAFVSMLSIGSYEDARMFKAMLER